MKAHKSITRDRIFEAALRAQHSLDDPGFCLACGQEVGGVEPDARKYECECCGETSVYGAEELVFMLGAEI